MNGPEHYREAEARVSAAGWQRRNGDLDTADHEAVMAQVHATLALAAATASAGVLGDYLELEDEAKEWARATVSATPQRPRPTGKSRAR